LDRNDRSSSGRDRGLEIYRLPDATTSGPKQNRDPGAGANAVIVRGGESVLWRVDLSDN